MRNRLLSVVPVLAMLGAAGYGGNYLWVNHYANRNLGLSAAGEQLQEKLGYHLYAPTWVPPRTDFGPLPIKEGRFRILTTFVDREGVGRMILAQERRSEERDAYNQRFVTGPDITTIEVHDLRAGFSTGGLGERRVAWFEHDMFLMLSSARLDDDILMQVAEGIK